MAQVDLGAPGWSLREGQAVWHSAGSGPEIAGELQLATNNESRVWLQFIKPPLPMVVAQLSRANWRLDVALGNRSYCGSGKPPARIAWLQLGCAVLGDEVAAGWVWKTKPDGGWRLENGASGEWIEGYFLP
jgi:hypothetical protein